MEKKVSLVKATEKDINLLYKLLIEAFTPVYEKYHDDETSPVKMSVERFKEKVTDVDSDFYIIYEQRQPVGGVRVIHQRTVEKGNVERISLLFIIPEYQNLGIAQMAISKIFEIYTEATTWNLSTIKQEKKNCYLYEKNGFVKVGTERIVNDKMTLVNYERNIKTDIEQKYKE